ncbi:MAG: hypothetical protein JRM76_08325 [Nitrososphaerota archaeon]|jgi:predicted AlkP superfamily phosphohydrolase/phosphomutase|nr:hypothetical protein [Nitrososphaerota archaeon]MDG6909995.1 hypothetical protein [Nitrososphaerota archaeon]MDG6937502.1 hypothetical protein [Nitrososphaerota archaeon]MDG6961616.1 hypothetical protein [Nitrososphaerota archaeon]MDG6969722.1 hypothetical protein [Nitrososphaerota archaeon]
MPLLPKPPPRPFCLSEQEGPRDALLACDLFDDLSWRSAGTVGHDSLYLSENDTGPDDSVHSMDGVFMMRVPGKDLGGRELEGLRIEDIGPTLLKLYGLEYGDGVDGRVVPEVVEACR